MCCVECLVELIIDIGALFHATSYKDTMNFKSGNFGKLCGKLRLADDEALKITDRANINLWTALGTI